MPSKRGVLSIMVEMLRKHPQTLAEMALYSTDDLRRLYQSSDGDVIRLRDGVVSRSQIVAVIRWRIFQSGAAWSILAVLSLVAALSGVAAAFLAYGTLRAL